MAHGLQAAPLSRRSKLIALALIVVSAAMVVWVATAHSRSKDFASYYVAGELVRSQPHNLYSEAMQRWGQAKFAEEGRFLPWAHPAPEALLFAPLTLLPYPAAFAVWMSISLVLLGVAGYLLRERFASIGDSGTYAVAAAAAVPIFAGLWGGQDHILTLVLFALAFLSAEEERDVAAGCWLGLALIRFQITLPLLLFFAVRRRWRVIGGAAAVGVVLLLVSFAIVGRGFVQSYGALLRFLGEQHDAGTVTYMPTVRGLVALVLPHAGHALAVVAAVSGAILLAAAWVWARARKTELALPYAAALLVALAVDYHGFMYEWSVMLLAGVLLVERKPETAWGLWAVGIVTVAILVSQTGLLCLLAPLPLLLAYWAERGEMGHGRLVAAGS